MFGQNLERRIDETIAAMKYEKIYNYICITYTSTRAEYDFFDITRRQDGTTVEAEYRSDKKKNRSQTLVPSAIRTTRPRTTHTKSVREL